MRVGWSGSRPDLFADPAAARREVDRRAAELVSRGDVESFVTGGQRGVDHWAAAAALRKSLPFQLVLPCPISRFTAGWSGGDRAELERLMGEAAWVEIVDRDGARGPLASDQRNERIVSQSERLAVIWTGLHRGGTFYTLCAAQEAGVAVQEIVLPGAPQAVLSGRGF